MLDIVPEWTYVAKVLLMFVPSCVDGKVIAPCQ